MSMVPAPAQWEPRDGRTVVAPTDAVAVATAVPASVRPDWLAAAHLLAELWAPTLGAALGVMESDVGDAVVVLRQADDLGDEGYRLDIADAVEVTATTRAGLLHGIHALWQLLGEDGSLPRVQVQDAPGLPWRGLMLDVVRHFMPVEFVLRVVDALALHRMNRLHLHLTDDQGWRLESRALPRLTEVGAWREETMTGHGLDFEPGVTPVRRELHGGFYTRDDIRRIVAHADRHGIVVVPEIDLPGHVTAALAAYPEFAVSDAPSQPVGVWGIFDNVLNLEDATIDAFRAVLEEVVELFPSPWVHLGGDECPTTRWAADPRTLERMGEVGLQDVGEVQNWFLGQVATVLDKADRRLVGWDELLDATPPADALIMAWRDAGQTLRAARAGYDVVSTPQDALYLDRYQVADHADEPLAIGGVTTLRDVYESALVPGEATAADRERIIGAQAQMWTEYTPTPADAAYMIFPRLCAFAENAWGTTGGGYDDFVTRLPRVLRRLDGLGVAYRPLSTP